MSEGGEARNHEAGIEMAADAVYDEFNARTTGAPRPSYSDLAKAAVDAYLNAVRCAQGRDTDAPKDQRPPLESGAPDFPHGSNANWYRRARSPQSDPTVSWQQWNDEVNTRISVQIELADARAEIKRLGELLDGETSE